MTRKIRIPIYIVFGLILTAVLFLSFFPYNALEKRIEAEAWHKLQINMDIRELGYAFPLGLDFTAVSIHAFREQLLDVQAGPGSAQLDIMDIFSGSLGGKFTAEMMGGKVKADVRLHPLSGPKEATLDLEWADVQADKISYLGKIPQAEDIKGKLSGNAVLFYPLGRTLPSRGNGTLLISDSSFKVASEMISGLSIKELNGEADWELNKREFKLDNLKYRAKGLDGELAGSILLHKNLPRSRMDLHGGLDISQGLPRAYSLARKYLKSTKLDFQLRGSPGQPKFTLK